MPGVGCGIGDVDCGGQIDFSDIPAFVQLLSDPDGWQAAYPGCDPLVGDIDGDGTVDFADITPFVALLSS